MTKAERKVLMYKMGMFPLEIGADNAATTPISAVKKMMLLGQQKALQAGKDLCHTVRSLFETLDGSPQLRNCNRVLWELF